MGTWAIDALGNDYAGDLLDTLYDGGGLDALDAAISGTVDHDYLEAPEGQQALAAAEVIARLQGRPDPSVSSDEELEAWVAANRQTVPPDLIHRTHLAIDRVLAEGSELRELWQESDEFEAWVSSVESLRSRLG